MAAAYRRFVWPFLAEALLGDFSIYNGSLRYLFKDAFRISSEAALEYGLSSSDTMPSASFSQTSLRAAQHFDSKLGRSSAAWLTGSFQGFASRADGHDKFLAS